jgi:hypothetical protein
MPLKKLLAPLGIAAVVAAVTFGGMSILVHADDGSSEQWKIQQGFAIAPVPLNLSGKNRELVGLGSYIANSQATVMAATHPTLLSSLARAGILTLASIQR